MKKKLFAVVLMVMMVTMIAIPSIAAAWSCEKCDGTSYTLVWYEYTTDSWNCTQSGCTVYYSYKIKIPKCRGCGAHDFTSISGRQETYNHSKPNCPAG